VRTGNKNTPGNHNFAALTEKTTPRLKKTAHWLIFTSAPAEKTAHWRSEHAHWQSEHAHRSFEHTHWQ